MEPPSAGPGGGEAAALVFAGCGEQEVALAKSFWNSVTLQPPLESRLGPRRASGGSGGGSSSTVPAAGSRKSSAGGLDVARRSCLNTQKNGPAPQPSAISRKGEAETLEDSELERVDDQKAVYLQKAKRREEILTLLRKQREERIMKEAVSQPYRPKTKVEESKLKVPESNLEDQEMVKALI
ncbi:cilia- and flagella-associated protein HOATZ [Heteronotia binoei]|uniref:cilia- and flagella-associated protein HOATZ n=1 Tax=Heteronotia binoei TaxID=13085 RepID=UPI00292D8194|nr:cilia- and flagella-associated protein HOATZ [Heteronotia binoei]